LSITTRPRITLVPSNGWGLGHLSREIAIALASEDSADVTMFSFSRGLPLASRLGIRGEFCPGQTSTWIPGERWNDYVENRFRAFIEEVQPDVVLFDGVAPYIGILNALLHYPSISAGWLRRGMWLPGKTEIQLTKASSFDFVIEPGDLAAESDTGPTATLDAVRVPPVSLLDVIPRLDRNEAADELRLDPSRRTLLFALGSGQPGDAADARSTALGRALKHDWQVGLVRSPLATGDSEDVPGAILLEGVYPLPRYLNAFDAAVSAAGYNSVHELIPTGIPTLLVPKSASQTDDQIARATWLAERGLALVAPDHDLAEVRRQVDSLLGGCGDELRRAHGETPGDTLGGATAVAGMLSGSPPTGVREAGGEEWRQPGFKGLVKRTIGPRGVALVQRVLGRAPRRPPRNEVSLAPNPPPGVPRLIVTTEAGDVARSPDQAVEHILSGTSDEYERTRRDLIEEYYEVI
jgi:UDP:flavonoid glycosyltransferase YjiC (YdhE family)